MQMIVNACHHDLWGKEKQYISLTIFGQSTKCPGAYTKVVYHVCCFAAIPFGQPKFHHIEGGTFIAHDGHFLLRCGQSPDFALSLIYIVIDPQQTWKTAPLLPPDMVASGCDTWNSCGIGEPCWEAALG